MSHPERAGLLAQILEQPHEDWPRLVFADWCEEHGDAVRAEFIRVQIELHGLDQGGHTPDPWHAHPRKECPQQYTADGCADCSRMIHYRGRERDLLCAHAIAWKTEIVNAFTGYPYSADNPCKGDPFTLGKIAGHLLDGGMTFRRGFVDSVCLSYDDLRAFLPFAQTLCPLTCVVATDKEPSLDSFEDDDTDLDDLKPCFCWWKPDCASTPASEAPADVWEILQPRSAPSKIPWDQISVKDYPTREAALSAFSNALLTIARRTA